MTHGVVKAVRMAAMTDTSALLSEQELSDWWTSPLVRHIGSDVPNIQRLMSNDVEVDLEICEEHLLFHFGTLAMLNGQRALWVLAYTTFSRRFGHHYAEDALAFLERMTSEARTALQCEKEDARVLRREQTDQYGRWHPMRGDNR